ncbi:UPF0323 family lipoprotein [Helicobacter mehlei]|uniref:UPF0323 domain-containing protein n=1 Tax=Helicobacter mehlei TaxID=2316080 RepID=A0A553UZF9_9HELI|nr:UPF0323 family lipoprotein [Helicobacter mehlei]TSA85570.1 hypothetical protein FNE76_03620 [Helicobacter mehlei]
MRRPFRKIADYAIVGGLSAVVVVTLAGCNSSDHNSHEQKPSEQSNTSNALKKGAFVILQEQADKSYKVAEEYPSDKTRVVVRDLQGKERMLSDEEIQKLIKDEETKIDQGTSQLTKPASEGGGSGLGIGAAILGSAAGAILGSYIGNKLFNNPNYNQNAQRNYTSPQAYQRSQNTFKSPSSPAGAPASSAGKSGFFKPSSSTPHAGGAPHTPSASS